MINLAKAQFIVNKITYKDESNLNNALYSLTLYVHVCVHVCKDKEIESKIHQYI